MRAFALRNIATAGCNVVLLTSAVSSAFHVFPTTLTASAKPSPFSFFSNSRTSLQSSEDNSVETAIDPEKNENSSTYNPFRLAVLKLGFTEPRFTSPLNYEKRDGLYVCANCKSPLFDSEGKYDSQSGWPSFYKTIPSESSDATIDSATIELRKEWDGRMECRCKKCKGHLGHVFMDGPKRSSLTQEELGRVPTSDPRARVGVPGERLPRFCVNGAALNFISKEE